KIASYDLSRITEPLSLLIICSPTYKPTITYISFLDGMIVINIIETNQLIIMAFVVLWNLLQNIAMVLLPSIKDTKATPITTLDTTTNHAVNKILKLFNTPIKYTISAADIFIPFLLFWM